MLKASFEALDPYRNHSFLLREFNEFTAPYHFHPECELTLIVRGTGNRYVGDHMDVYQDGDLVLIGPNLPHCWKNDALQDQDPGVASVVIQFNVDFLGKDLFGKPEFGLIAQLLERSEQGIHFTGKTAALIKKQMISLAAQKDPFKRSMGLLDMLQTLALSKEYQLMDKQAQLARQTGHEAERVNAVLAYIIDNYQQDISLNEAAAIVNMTSNAFCKYYKKTTGKTFIETVTDYRINYAVHQLVHSDLSIADICFSNGFGDLSHFYKLFKRKMKLSPLQYRKHFRKDL